MDLETIALLEEVLSVLNDETHGTLKAKVTNHIPRISEAVASRREKLQKIADAHAEAMRLRREQLDVLQSAVKTAAVEKVANARLPLSYSRNLRLAIAEIDLLKTLE